MVFKCFINVFGGVFFRKDLYSSVFPRYNIGWIYVADIRDIFSAIRSPFYTVIRRGGSNEKQERHFVGRGLRHHCVAH